MSTQRKCRVSFTDCGGITHSVEVAAGSVYVEAPATTHELPLKKLEMWLTSSAKGPADQLLKQRLRELVGLG